MQAEPKYSTEGFASYVIKSFSFNGYNRCYFAMPDKTFALSSQSG